MARRQSEALILNKLQKAVHSGNISAVVPEDLEVEAHSTLWEETSPTQLTILKLLPSVPASNIVHEYTRVTSYGNRRGSGFFSERSLPPETNFTTERVETNIKLMGEIGPTFLLAALEKTQRALGTSGAQNMERVALRRNLLQKKANNLYHSDTRKTRNGTSSNRFKGLFQLIEEGTDANAPGFTGVNSEGSPYGSHIIDMQGQPLNFDTIRDKFAKAITLFGAPSCMLMDPLTRGDLELSMDPAQRLAVPTTFSPLMVGQNLGGIQTQNGRMYFETDNTLSPIYARPQYSTTVHDGAPTGTPTVAATAGADGTSPDTSKWDASSAGDCYWVVTEMVDEMEGLGTRFPAALGSFTAVAADQEVTLTLTPSSAETDSFKVYRGRDADGQDALSDAWFIFEVSAAAGGGAVTAYDDNLYRPNTSWAFALNIVSASANALHTPSATGTLSAYENARARSANFLSMADSPRNTVAVATLGPAMGILALASILAEVDRPLMYSACAPEMRNPFQNFGFINIGRA